MKMEISKATDDTARLVEGTKMTLERATRLYQMEEAVDQWVGNDRDAAGSLFNEDVAFDHWEGEHPDEADELDVLRRLRSSLEVCRYGYSREPFTPEGLVHWCNWHVASGHPDGWRVSRGLFPQTELEGKSGRVVLFKTKEAAQKRADKLNKPYESK